MDNSTTNSTSPDLSPDKIIIIISLFGAVLFIAIIVTTIIVSLSCWCYYRRKKRRDLLALTKEKKIIELSDYSQSANNKKTYFEVKLSPLDTEKELNKDEEVILNTNSIPLTEDGYATLEPDNDIVSGVDDQHYDYTLPIDVTTGYDNLEKVEEDSGKPDDNYDYEELFWEPANKEEELMAQISKLALPVILADNVQLKDRLGSGEFGSVYRGLWRRRSEENNTVIETAIEVAVKSLKDEASEEERVKFLKEAAIMGQFNHVNIVRILGIVFDDPAHMEIIMEIMPKGDLLHHLISLRPREGQKQCSELGAVLLSYTRQIALGMTYLSVKEFVHRDLAARNILVSDDCVCKIADFGLSRNLQNEDYYVSHGGKIPVKWTAPEALHYHKYSTVSDVWSYGCLLYEIWSLGCKPFHDVTNAQVMQKVASGYRLPPPPGCSRNVYSLMIKCWNPTPASRPHFCDIITQLQQPDFRILRWKEEDLSACESEEAKIIGSPIEKGYSLYKDLQTSYLSVSGGNLIEIIDENDLNTVDSNKM